MISENLWKSLKVSEISKSLRSDPKIGLISFSERDELAYEIHEYMSSMSNRTDEGKYLCIVCGIQCRDLYNQREHVLTHMVKEDPKFNARLQKFVNFNIIKDSNSKECRICKTKITVHVRKHFINKHLRLTSRDVI